MRKKVVLLIVDALTERCLIPLLDEGFLPNLEALRSRAEVVTSCYSVFPSITHAAITSISTGKYPRETGILGSHWHRAESSEIAYYSADLELVFKEGISGFLTQFLTKLNDEHLESETIFDRLHAAGKTAGTVNFLSFSGPHPHQVDLPALLKLLPGLDIHEETVYGPDQLFLGEIMAVDVDDIDPLSLDPFRWFGMRDEGTFAFLKQLVAKHKLPDFTLAYFPHNDKRSHDLGPDTAHQQLVDFDQRLGEVFDQAGGIDRFLEEVVVLITGDHSQSQISDQVIKAAVDLDTILDAYTIAPAGEPWQDEHELMICPNMRSAIIYARPHVDTDDLVAPLLADERIDQVIWQDEQNRFHVKSGSAELIFWRGGRVFDEFENGWDWDGDLRVVDARIYKGRLSFSRYPNAFERIEGVLPHPNAGRLWVTARPGSDLVVELTKAHVGGGSHGSLHRVDSVAPLWIIGEAPPENILPQPARLIDLAPLCEYLVTH